jgi:putative thiamine transport system permease protein
MVLLLFLPLVLSIILVLPGLTDIASFTAAFEHPQFGGALKLTLWTGITSTALALCFAIIIVSSLQIDQAERAAWFLAVPHVALALGLGFLLAPTGLLARFIATIFTGWTSPPDWQTVQDSSGFGLIMALVLKETPFLVWAMAQVLSQDELRQRFSREIVVARSLGHDERSSFYRVLLPQILPRITWPLVAVFSYGMTVVDMALVIGPGQPPTLAQLVWTDLNDGDKITNARGASGNLVLSGAVFVLLAMAWLALRLLRPALMPWLTAGHHPELPRFHFGTWLWRFFILTYVVVVATLLLQSISLLWPFPNLLATVLSFKAWGLFLWDFWPLLNTFALAAITSVIALLACVTWLESQLPAYDRIALAAATIVLCLPAVLLAFGEYRLLLQLGWTGTWAGLLLAHFPFVLAYVFIMLQGPYRAYDHRWQQVSQGVGVSRGTFLRYAKWPMLKGPMLSSLAVGFAVSAAQFVPSQLASAGRYSTLPIEAVTLSTGGNRALISVAALLLMAMPLLAFQLAARLGRPRWSAFSC